MTAKDTAMTHHDPLDVACPSCKAPAWSLCRPLARRHRGPFSNSLEFARTTTTHAARRAAVQDAR